MDYRREDYSIALQRAVEYHCKGKLIPDYIASECPHHAEMLNRHPTNQSNRPDSRDACSWYGGDCGDGSKCSDDCYEPSGG